MQKYNAVAALFLLVALVGSVSAISSSQAKDLGKNYVLSSSEYLSLTSYTGSNALVVDGERYWVIYYAGSQPDKYVSTFDKVVISDSTGQVVLDEPTLQSVFKLDYEYAWEQNYVVPLKLTYTDIASGADTVRQTLKAADSNIAAVQKKVLANSTDPKVETYFENLRDAINGDNQMMGILDDLSAQELANGKTFEKQFSDTNDASTLHDAVMNYNATFTKLATFMDSAENFFNLLSNREMYAYLDSDEASVLQKVYSQGLGTDAFYSARQFRDEIIPQFNDFVSYEDREVNDSVKSSRFRVQKALATKAYNDASQKVPGMLSSFKTDPAAFQRCNVAASVTSLNATWSAVLNTMENKPAPDATEFSAVRDNITKAITQYNAINDGLTNCGKTPTPTSGGNASGNLDWPIIVVVLLLVAFGFWQYQKWKKKKAEEEEVA